MKKPHRESRNGLREAVLYEVIRKLAQQTEAIWMLIQSRKEEHVERMKGKAVQTILKILGKDKVSCLLVVPQGHTQSYQCSYWKSWLFHF